MYCYVNLFRGDVYKVDNGGADLAGIVLAVIDFWQLIILRVITFWLIVLDSAALEFLASSFEFERY
jgi:hypothetical protein